MTRPSGCRSLHARRPDSPAWLRWAAARVGVGRTGLGFAVGSGRSHAVASVRRLAVAAGLAIAPLAWGSDASLRPLDILVPVPAAAQEPYSPLVPRGQVRLGLLGAYTAHSHVYALGELTGGPHRLSGRFSGPVGSGVFPFLAAYDALVNAAIGEEHAVDGGHETTLGMMSSVLELSAARVPVTVDAGVFDWLTVGATAPLVQNDTEFAAVFGADMGSANTGFNPGIDDPGAVSGFLSDLQGSIGAFDAVRAQTCAADPTSQACTSATALIGDARAFERSLSVLYRGAFAPFSWSAAGRALAQRLAGLVGAFEAAGVATLPGAMPLAESFLTREDIEAMATDPAFGIASAHPFDNWRSRWRIGDIEVRADARAHRFGDLALGAGTTVRLPTGTQDEAAHFFDSGSGDGQMDIEGRAWLHGRLRDHWGLWADLRYGVQMPGTTVRRVAPPEVGFAPAAAEVTLDWNPGDYLTAELSPWYRIADELSAVAGFRYFRKGDDAFSIAVAPVEEVVDEGGAGPGPAAQTGEAVDPAVLVPGTGGSVGRALLGLVYSRTGERGGVGGGNGDRPLEIRVFYRRAVLGSGAMPVSHSLEAGFRFFWDIW